MKLGEFRIESGQVQIRVDAETMKDVGLLMQAATGVKADVQSYGLMSPIPFAWFMLPFSDKKTTRSFDNGVR